MVWVLVFAAIAVGALVVLVGYAVWLAHKTADVLNEVGVLADRAGELFDLLGQIQPPGSRADADPTGWSTDRLPAGRIDVR
jgi:hypothetical protein